MCHHFGSNEVSVMKLLLFCMFVLTTTGALADQPACQEEAQFIGSVRNHQQQTADGSMCSFQMDFSQYNESMVCGLNDADASTALFFDAGCTMKDGDQVSGYLVKKWGVVLWEGH
jgi:hypothetical protein